MPAYKLKYSKDRDPVRVTPDSSAVIARGTLLRLDPANDEVLVATTNNSYSYIAEEASASGSTTPISATRLRVGDRIVGNVTTGTPTSSMTGGYVDIDTAGVNVTPTNNDFVGYYNGTTDTMDLECLNVI